MKIVVLNEKRVNLDGNIDMSIIGDDVVLYDYTERKDIVNRCIDAEIVITKEIKIDKEIIDSLTNTKVIMEAGTGYDNIDIEYCRLKNIIVMNVPEYASNSVAEYVITYMLNLSRIGSYQELKGRTLGIIGTGKIGNRVIELASAFGMEILAYSRTRKDNINYVSLDELLKRSDYISVNLPLTDETYHLLNEDKLSLIKNGAFLINTSRGKVIDEKALVKLLDNGILKGAALDVLENEPITDDNPLKNRENVILTPHLCWSSIEARKNLVNTLKDNIDSYNSGDIINKVN